MTQTEATVSTDRLRAAELAERTPASRNRYVDLLRVTSLGVVVIGHWLMAGIWIEDGEINARNVLELVPALQYLTWLLQVMPVFFFVGGYANAASWRSAERKGIGYAQWLRGRMVRLLRPTLIFVAVWSALAAFLAEVAEVDPDIVSSAARLLAMPLWFLAVYIMVIPVAPAMLELHDRFGLRALVALVAVAGVVDLARLEFGLDWMGWGNYLFVWLAIHQLGFYWWEGRAGCVRKRFGLAALGLATMVMLTAFGVYSHSMLGVGDEGNTSPPTLMLIVLGVWQFGLLLGFEEPARRWLQRRTVWKTVITANGMAMTVYLWHQTAMVIAVVVAFVSGFGLRGTLLTGSWWASRPVWIVAVMLTLVPLLALFLRVERTAAAADAGGSGVVAFIGAILTAAGLSGLVLQGFLPGSGPGGIAAMPLMLLGAGAMLLLRHRRPGPPNSDEGAANSPAGRGATMGRARRGPE